MWDCSHCGCKAIAPGYPHCPMCMTPPDVAAEPGQPSEASGGSPVGSKTPEADPPPSGKNSGAAPSSPKTSKLDSDWGKK